MRKTSHDGLDSTSVTSGLENEIKKTGQGLIKSKKNSIKRKVPNFSHESDDGIIEPLLQTDKDKIDNANRSAKYMLAKTKTDSISEVEDLNIVSENVAILSAPTPISTTNKVPSNNIKDYPTCTTDDCVAKSILNQKQIRVSNTSETGASKNSILVEFDGSKISYNPSPLIFTTAKIHADSKTKLMDPVPILSTVEGSDKVGIISSGSGEKIVRTDLQLNNLQNFSNMSKDNTCNEILGLKDISKYSESRSQNLVNKIVTNKAESSNFIKTDTNIPKSVCSERYSSKEIATSEPLKAIGKDSFHTILGSHKEKLEATKQFDPNKIGKEESVTQGQQSCEPPDKPSSTLSKSNSKKLQRQKKTTIDDISSSNNIKKDTIMDDKSPKTGINNTISSISCHITTNTGTTSLPSNKSSSQTSMQSSSRVYLPQNKFPLNISNTAPIVTSTINKISTEVKSDGNTTNSTSLPPYIVPTSKTIIEAHRTAANDTDSKPETFVSTTKTIITTPKEEVTAISNVMPHDTLNETVSAVNQLKAEIKNINIGKSHETVTKAISSVAPRPAINKTTSNIKSPEAVTKATSTVTPRETLTKTSSTIKPRDGIMKTAGTVAPREAIIKTTSSVTPSGIVTKTTTAVSHPEAKTMNTNKSREVVPKTTSNSTLRETSIKTTSAVTTSAAVTKSVSAVTQSDTTTKNTSTVIPREESKTTSRTLPLEVIPKTISTVSSHDKAKDTREASKTTTNTMTPNTSITKTSNNVTPRETVKKTTSSETESKTNNCTTSREELVKTTGARDSVTPPTNSECKTTKSASSSNDINRNISHSKQAESKTDTINKDRRA